MYLIETRISNPQHMQISRHYAVKHLLININVNSSNFAYNSKHIITCPIPNFKFKKMNSFDGRVYPLEFLAPNFHCVFAFLNENVTPGLTFKHINIARMHHWFMIDSLISIYRNQKK